MKTGEKLYGGRLQVLKTFLGKVSEAAGEMVPLSQIRTNLDWPPVYFGETKLASHAAPVKEHGVLQPLLVRPLQPGDGRFRDRVATVAGLEKVPAAVSELSSKEALELALLENLQREDLNPVEETDVVLRLLGSQLGKPADDVIAIIRMLRDEPISRGR